MPVDPARATRGLSSQGETYPAGSLGGNTPEKRDRPRDGRTSPRGRPGKTGLLQHVVCYDNDDSASDLNPTLGLKGAAVRVPRFTRRTGGAHVAEVAKAKTEEGCPTEASVTSIRGGTRVRRPLHTTISAQDPIPSDVAQAGGWRFDRGWWRAVHSVRVEHCEHSRLRRTHLVRRGPGRGGEQHVVVRRLRRTHMTSTIGHEAGPSCRGWRSSR